MRRGRRRCIAPRFGREANRRVQPRYVFLRPGRGLVPVVRKGKKAINFLTQA